MSDKPLPRMNVIAAQYQTRNSYINSIPSGLPTQVLWADPRRFYVRFETSGGGAANMAVLPGPLLPTASPSAGSALPVEYKWKDCPSIVAGEWWAYNANLASLVIIECLYVGDL